MHAGRDHALTCLFMCLNANALTRPSIARARAPTTTAPERARAPSLPASLTERSRAVRTQARLQCSRAGGAPGPFPRFFVKQTNVASVCGQRLRAKECLRRRTLIECLVSDTVTAFTGASMPRSLGLRCSRLGLSSLTSVSDDATCELVFACLFPFEVSLYPRAVSTNSSSRMFSTVAVRTTWRPNISSCGLPPSPHVVAHPFDRHRGDCTEDRSSALLCCTLAIWISTAQRTNAETTEIAV